MTNKAFSPFRPDQFDPEALDASLAQLVTHAQGARDCFIMGDHIEGQQQFELAIVAICKGVHQLYMRNR